MKLIVSLLDSDRGKLNVGDFVDDAEYALGASPVNLSDTEVFTLLCNRYSLPDSSFNKGLYTVSRREETIRIVPVYGDE